MEIGYLRTNSVRSILFVSFSITAIDAFITQALYYTSSQRVINESLQVTHRKIPNSAQ